ncbi:MAG: hypothetical protein ABIK09_18245 [Pseudomonadota bacterium]
MRTKIILVAVLFLVGASCGKKDTVIKYSGFDPGGSGEDGGGDSMVPEEDLSPGADIIEGTRYLIVLKEDTSQPLELIVGDHYPVKARVWDNWNDQDAAWVDVTYLVMAADPECEEAPPCGQFLVKQAQTNADGEVSVTFEAGEVAGELYDVKVTAQNAIPDAMQILVSDPPEGILRLTLQYEGAVPIHEIKLHLMKGPASCQSFDPLSPWIGDDVVQEKVVSSIASVAVFDPQDIETTWVVFAMAKGPTDTLAAKGCLDNVHLLPEDEGVTEATLQLHLMPLNATGIYDTTNVFNFTGAIPGEAGLIIDTVVNLFTDPGVVIIDLIKMAIATQIGELATDAIFGLFEDMLADLISDWLLNNSPDFIQDLFVVGQDLIQIVHHVTLTSDLYISKLQNDYYVEGTQFFLGITLYWKLGCAEEGEPDYDPECGALPLTLEDLEDTEIPVNILEGKFTATVDNWNHLTVSKHEIQLNYGALILFVINDLLLPAVSEYSSIEDLLYSLIDCHAIATGFAGDLLGALGISEQDIEDTCNGAVTLIISPVEEMISSLSLDSHLVLWGDGMMRDDDGDLYVDRFESGSWEGYIYFSSDPSDQGNIFTGTWHAEKEID